jgi:hypothetical protein
MILQKYPLTNYYFVVNLLRLKFDNVIDVYFESVQKSRISQKESEYLLDFDNNSF